MDPLCLRNPARAPATLGARSVHTRTRLCTMFPALVAAIVGAQAPECATILACAANVFACPPCNFWAEHGFWCEMTWCEVTLRCSPTCLDHPQGAFLNQFHVQDQCPSCTHAPEFTFFATPKSWPAAQADCKARGGHMARIRSDAENDAAYALTGGGDAWLGLTDAQGEGTWAWDDSSPVEYSPNFDDQGSSGSRLAVIGGGSGDGNSSCAGYKSDRRGTVLAGQWEVLGGVESCSAAYGYLCQLPARAATLPPPPPSPPPSPLPPYISPVPSGWRLAVTSVNLPSRGRGATFTLDATAVAIRLTHLSGHLACNKRGFGGCALENWGRSACALPQPRELAESWELAAAQRPAAPDSLARIRSRSAAVTSARC